MFTLGLSMFSSLLMFCSFVVFPTVAPRKLLTPTWSSKRHPLLPHLVSPNRFILVPHEFDFSFLYHVYPIPGMRWTPRQTAIPVHTTYYAHLACVCHFLVVSSTLFSTPQLTFP